MAVPIPASHMRLLTDPIVAHLATLLSDGRPQVNPVWCNYDGTYVRVNAAADRQKTRNMQRRGLQSLWRMAPILMNSGRVIHSTTEGAMDHAQRRRNILAVTPIPDPCRSARSPSNRSESSPSGPSHVGSLPHRRSDRFMEKLTAPRPNRSGPASITRMAPAQRCRG
jgi:hypothetical protein